MNSGKTVVNTSIIGWSLLIIIELFIIAFLVDSGLVLLFSILLISPITAAFNWPAPEQITNGEVKTTETAAEKA